jgi:hypothetical protein
MYTRHSRCHEYRKIKRPLPLPAAPTRSATPRHRDTPSAPAVAPGPGSAGRPGVGQQAVGRPGGLAHAAEGGLRQTRHATGAGCTREKRSSDCATRASSGAHAAAQRRLRRGPRRVPCPRARGHPGGPGAGAGGPAGWAQAAGPAAPRRGRRGEHRRRTRRTLAGGHVPGRSGAGPPRAAEAGGACGAPHRAGWRPSAATAPAGRPGNAPWPAPTRAGAGVPTCRAAPPRQGRRPASPAAGAWG